MYTILAIVARSPFVSLIILDPLVIMRNPEVKEAIVAIKTKIKRKLGFGESSQEQPNLQNSNSTTISSSTGY